MTNPFEADIVSAKTATRRQVLARRDALSHDVHQAKSTQICAEAFQVLQKRLKGARDEAGKQAAAKRETDGQAVPESSFNPGLPARCAGTSASSPLIGLFASMKSEVDVWELVQRIYAAGWRACFPCVPSPGYMEFFEVPADRMQQFFASGNSADLPEFMAKPLKRFTPEELSELGFPLVSAQDIDALVCPLVAFDKQSKRLGYGGGNYDRYLEQLRSDALVFGIAFAEQRVDHVPCEPHDLPLPLIISA